MPKISVIVPVYKVEEYINRCVNSILNQTFTDFELILVDDGSPDLCPKICDEYKEKDNRVIVIHKENGGLSDARNAGIEYALNHSNSGWIAFIDSDDWVNENYLGTLYYSACEYGVNISTCEFCLMPAKWSLFSDDDVEVLTPEEFWIKSNSYSIAYCKLYRKELFLTARFPKGKVFEDEPTNYPIIFNEKAIVYNHGALYNYFINDEGISHSVWNPKRLYILETLPKELKFLKKRKLDKAYGKVRERLYNWYQQTIEEACLVEGGQKYKKEIRWARKKYGKFLRKNRKRYPIRYYADAYLIAYPKRTKLVRFFEKLDVKFAKLFNKGKK